MSSFFSFTDHAKPICFIFILAFISTLAGCMGENKFEQEITIEKSGIKLTREVQRGGYGLISTDELKSLVDSGKEFVLVDTMPFESSYAKNHIPRAKQFLFPIPEMVEWNSDETGNKSPADFQELLGENKEKTIVIYCGFVKCTRSHNGAKWAVKLGYKNVKRYPGGIFAWKGANYQTDSIN